MHHFVQDKFIEYFIIIKAQYTAIGNTGPSARDHLSAQCELGAEEQLCIYYLQEPVLFGSDAMERRVAWTRTVPLLFWYKLAQFSFAHIYKRNRVDR